MLKIEERCYPSPRAFLKDLCYLVGHAGQVRRMMRGGILPADFRERIMLAVTEVNHCRVCSYVHTRAALRAGIAEAEVAAILQGAYDDCPEEERTAVLFAQHWAESEGKPEAEALARLEEIYGAEKSAAILLALRLISCGNYSFRTVEYWLNRLSFGRLCAPQDKPSSTA